MYDHLWAKQAVAFGQVLKMRAEKTTETHKHTKDVKREGKWNFSNVCLQFPVLRLISFKKKKKKILYEGGMPALSKIFFLEV